MAIQIVGQNTSNILVVNSAGAGAVAYDGSNAYSVPLTSGGGSVLDNLAYYGGTLVSVTNPINVQPVSAYFFSSTGNSSTAQLGAGATFTGTIESVLNQPALSLLITSDQPFALVLNQYIDAAGAYKAAAWTYNVKANQQFAQSFTLNANYFNLSLTNTGASATTLLNINAYYGTLPAAGSTPSQGAMPVVVASDQIVPISITGGVGVNASSLQPLSVDSLGKLVETDIGGLADIMTQVLLEVRALKTAVIALDNTANPVDFDAMSYSDIVVSETVLS